MSFLLHKVFLIFLGNQTVFFYHKMDPARLKFNKHNVFKSYRDVFLLLYIIFLICEFVTRVTNTTGATSGAGTDYTEITVGF